ncbi:MAG: beta-ketoacyl-[acyl-carrier-protein] synthase family protein [Betaproteobacteria bacterium]
MKRRVVVTGLGVVTPFGCDPRALWDALASGRSGVRAVESVDGSPGVSTIGAPVADFEARSHIDPKSLRLMSPAVAFGVAAAQLAAGDSGCAFEAIDPGRFGVFVGSRGHSSDRQDLLPAVRAASRSGSFRLDSFGTDGLPLVHPMWLLKGLANNVLYFVSLKYNAQGMNNNISMGGVGGTMAIGEAFHTIQRGYVDVAIAGGYDSALDADRVEMFAASGLVTKATDPSLASRPFDRRRDGFVMSEGAGFVVLETLDAARRRGARVYGEVLGYGTATAPASAAALGPSARGFAGALCAALGDAGIGRPDAIFTCGLATVSSDVEETRGIRAAFGADAGTIPAPALKSMLGNTFAASGVIEAAAALLALEHSLLPPTVNLTEPDTACDLDYVAGTSARPASLRTMALLNANLGGGHAALILGRAE